MTDCINLPICPLHGTHIQYTTSIPKIQPIVQFLFEASRQKSLIDKLKSRVYLMAYSRRIVQLDTTPNLPPAHP